MVLLIVGATVAAGLFFMAWQTHRTWEGHPPPKAPREPQPLTAGKVFMVGLALIVVVLFLKGFAASTP